MSIMSIFGIVSLPYHKFIVKSFEKKLNDERNNYTELLKKYKKLDNESITLEKFFAEIAAMQDVIYRLRRDNAKVNGINESCKQVLDLAAMSGMSAVRDKIDDALGAYKIMQSFTQVARQELCQEDACSKS